MISYELTPAHWEIRRITTDDEELDSLLAEGWEPFATTDRYTVFLRKYHGRTVKVGSC